MAKILIVDDSPTELHVLTKILQQGGHEALTAADGESGIATAKSQGPDAILMDVVMPGLNGFQATRKLSRDPKTQHIPVLMVTTKDQETDREWGMRQGAKGYLVKPVDGKELLQKITELLG
ncbi:MAG: response regulator [Chromatiaceae bacterium]|nr:response regulator [Gammaproteobacteria bacterium]MCP5313219.1 response regulator [Chromatiaceae bacterium]